MDDMARLRWVEEKSNDREVAAFIYFAEQWDCRKWHIRHRSNLETLQFVCKKGKKQLNSFDSKSGPNKVQNQAAILSVFLFV